MTSPWHRLSDPTDVRRELPAVMAALTAGSPGRPPVTYRHAGGGLALALPVGAWLTGGAQDIRWEPSAAAAAPDDDVLLLTGEAGLRDVEELRAVRRRDGLSDVTLIGLVASDAARALAATPGTWIRWGTLTLGRGSSALPVAVLRRGDPASSLHEAPPAMRKRPEGPTNLQERERWFRSRTEPGS